MTEPHIQLMVLGDKLHGLSWQSNRLLRVGRSTHLDIVLPDISVDRLHAEIKHEGLRWVVRDLAENPLYPTFVNHFQVLAKEHALNVNDVIQLGKVRLKVLQLVSGTVEEKFLANRQAGTLPPFEEMILAGGDQVQMLATTRNSWDQALENVALHVPHRAGNEKSLLALVRANYHLTCLSQMDELLQSVLSEATAALQAQRGTIILADPHTGNLMLRATLTPHLRGRCKVVPFNRTLAQRCFDQGESGLCRLAEEEEALARTVQHGAMASIICALMRTPGKRIGVLHLDRGCLDEPFTEEDLLFADAIAASVAVCIEAALCLEQEREQVMQTFTALARTVQARDQYASDHTSRLTNYSLLLAEELKLSSNEKYQIQIATPLYDIGKIGIDDAILRKPGKLTSSEFEEMKTHTVKGATLLNSMTHLSQMISIVRHHHEHWDGGGYPDGLAREGIPLTARIVAVADAFAAMTVRRPYRDAMPSDQAFLELIGKAGTHFDPACVYAFVKARHKVENVTKVS